MKMKKTISKILALVLVFSLSFGIFGEHEYVRAEDEPTISIDTVEAKPGDTVTIKVLLENNPGFIGSEMLLCYDDGLTLVGMAEGVLGGTYSYNKNNFNSPYRIMWESEDFEVDVTTSGLFVEATFLVKEDAKAGTTHKVWIEYEEDLIFNANMDNVHFEVVAGGVTIPASACAHSYTNYVSNGDATCEADGTKTATCDRGCGTTNTVTDEGSKKGHSFTKYESNGDATCEANGTKTATCDNGCGETETITDVGSEKGHSFTKYESNNDATCEADGTKTATCDNGCGKKDTIADTGSKKGHKFTNYISNDDATYFADGTETAVCDHGCGKEDTKTDVGSKLVDEIAPNGEIKIAENTWKKVLNTITFGIFFKDAFDVTITATDDETGVKSVEYYKSNTAVADVTTITNWTEYETFGIASEGEYVIYAKITDNSGNVSYISTDGLVLDSTKPVISGVVANGKYCDDVVINVTDAYAMDVTVNGKVVSLNADGSYTLEAVDANGTEYTVVATDKAGNATTVVVTVYDGHHFVNYESNGDATCTKDGTETGKCASCDETNTRIAEGSKLPHKFITYVSNDDATCAADGTKTAYCEYGCGAKDTVADEGTQKEHKFTTYKSDNNATCDADGTKTATCDNGCGTKDTIKEEGTQKEHLFTKYVSDKNATYFVDGTETAVCDHGCGKKDTKIDEGSKLIDTIAPNGEIKIGENTWKKVLNTITFGVFFKDTFEVTITGTDNETGVKSVEYFKSNVAVEDVQAITDWTTYEKFNVASEGEYVIYAKITDNSGNICYLNTDGLVLDVTKPAISGVVPNGEYCDDVVINVKDAYAMDVTVNGKVVSLDGNGNYTLEAVDANGTEYTVVATDKAGNATTVVVKVYDGHQFVNYESNGDATCTKDGTETAKCTCCDETNTRTEVGSQLAHKYITYVSNNDATCEKDGTKTASCEYGCGTKNTITDEGTAKGHKYTTYVSNNDATCEADGTKTATCNNGCGTKDTVTDAGSKIAHNFNQYVSNNDATCEADGTKTATCTYGCGTKDTIADEGSKVDHIYEKYVENNDATCQKNETKTASCKFGCGKTNTVEIPDSTVDHVYTTYESNNDATCKENGTKTAECDFECGTLSIIEDEDTMLDHKVDEWTVTKEPTLDEFGEKEGVCTLCNDTITEQIEKLVQKVEAENGTKLECGDDVTLDANTKLEADIVTDEIPEETIEDYKEEIDKILPDKTIAEVWTLTLTLDNEELKLSGPVTITISINPELLEKYTSLQVVCIDENNNFILLDSKVVETASTYSLRARATGAEITFTTETMGTFIIVGEEVVVDGGVEDDKDEDNKNENAGTEEDKKEDDEKEDDDTIKAPTTGDSTSFGFVMLLLIVAVIAFMLSSKLKYQNKTK